MSELPTHFFGAQAASALEYTATALPRISEIAQAECNLAIVTAGQLTVQLASLPRPLPRELPATFTSVAGEPDWQVGYQFREYLPHETASGLGIDTGELQALASFVRPFRLLPFAEISAEAGEIPIAAGALPFSEVTFPMLEEMIANVRGHGLRSDGDEAYQPPFWMMVALGKNRTVDFRPFQKLPPGITQFITKGS